jgi:hydroxymethylglutaryl-CoA lyase
LVSNLFTTLFSEQKQVEFGAHLHVLPQDAESIIEAAFSAGCRRFDGAIKGYGGCPMAKDDLTGNMPTEKLLDWFARNDVKTQIDPIAFNEAYTMSSSIFI